MARSSVDWSALLQDFRTRQGLKQEAAAELLGVSQASISRWERGAGAPSVGVRNQIYRALRRQRSPLATLEWIKTFRSWLVPGLASSECRSVRAMTDVLAARLGAPADAFEGMNTDDIFVGEAREITAAIRDAGVFAGEVASYEACALLELNPAIRRDKRFHIHYVGWPHFDEGDDIVAVRQGVFVDEDRARDIRARLGGPVRFAAAA